MSYKYFYSLNYKKINKNKKKIKAVFLDRDGTLNIDTGYINDIKDIRMMPGTYKALRSFADMGFHLVIITNQSGIARGLIDQDQLKKVNREMLLKFKRKNIEFLGIYFCPHFKEGVVEAFSFECRCRKPNAFMIKRAEADFNIDLKKSVMIGDKISDIQAGKNAGLKTVLVNSGIFSIEDTAGSPVKPDFIAGRLTDAVSWIKKNV